MSNFNELFELIEAGDLAAVRRITAAQPELVLTSTVRGYTLLMRATSTHDRTIEMIWTLLDGGAEINRQTAEGYTALHCAIDVDGEAELKRKEVIGLLVKRGADLNLRQHYGWTPLLCAVIEGSLAEVEALLAAGSDPNVTLPLDTLPAFNSGRTALTAALCNANSDAIVEALLRFGADPCRADAHGATFFERADQMMRETLGSEHAASVQHCLDIAERMGRPVS